jgi:hypothetical protein
MLTKTKLITDLAHVKELQKVITESRKMVTEIDIPSKYLRIIESLNIDPRPQTKRWGFEVCLISNYVDSFCYGIYLLDYYGSQHETPDMTIVITLDQFIELEEAGLQGAKVLLKSLVVK